MASMFDNQYKLLARSGNKVQEVIFAFAAIFAVFLLELFSLSSLNVPIPRFYAGIGLLLLLALLDDSHVY